MRLTFFAVPVLLAGSVAADCAADNCLRAMRATQTPGRLQTAQAFCSTFTTTSVAATAIPTFAVKNCKDNQNGDMYERISSACSCIATSTSSSSTTSTGPTSTGACARVSSSWSVQNAAGTPTPTVAAALANACLEEVPLHQQEAIDLVDAMIPYLEWQSDPAYLKNPPSSYFYPGFDLFGDMASIRSKLEASGYDGEYEFHNDLYATCSSKAHDGHFVFYTDLLTKVFNFNRRRNLISVSEDGVSLPVIKIYEDFVANPSTASVVTHINGQDAAEYVADTVNKGGFNQDADAAYNSMFYSKTHVALGLAGGYFKGGGRLKSIYPGPNTTFTFANGSEITLENYSNVLLPFTGVTDGEALYQACCVPSATAAAAPAATSSPAAAATSVVGYPPPLITTQDAIVSCYDLDGEGFEDVMVIALLAFESESPQEFQAVTDQCFALAKQTGKTKLVVDFQGNGGGYILQGYDFFRQLFPDIVPDGFSRWKENDGYMAVADVYSQISAPPFNPNTSANANIINAYLSWFNWRYDLDINNQPFTSFEDKFSPDVKRDTPYTQIMRWDLWDPLTWTNTTFGMGIELTGHRSRANFTQPFAAEDIIILYDGFCASTCTLASEMLRIQGGVKSVAFGGRPQPGPIDGVGGVKGAQVLSFSSINFYVNDALNYGLATDEEKAAIAKYTDLPMQRSTASSVNTRDQILRGNVNDGIPAQFVREEADCRLFYTESMITDVSAIWKATADAAFNGKQCADGGISKPAGYPTKRAAPRTDVKVNIERKGVHVELPHNPAVKKRSEMTTTERIVFDAKYRLALPEV